MKHTGQMGSLPDLTKQYLLVKSALSGWHISRASNMALTNHYKNVQMYKFP